MAGRGGARFLWRDRALCHARGRRGASPSEFADDRARKAQIKLGHMIRRFERDSGRVVEALRLGASAMPAAVVIGARAATRSPPLERELDTPPPDRPGEANHPCEIPRSTGSAR
jgi:hypothetical protein